ncbi:MAG TPA: aminotransferase class V-fold PLP-dependent enzyme [Gemmatimonadaceae bacterium]|nr:aminotransferase class V-fold PLP-dependent enzyme [Gemmatimonadaceae bacterium]
MPDAPLRSNLELDDSTMRLMGRRIADLVVDHLASLREQPAQQSLSRHDTESLIGGPPSEDGRDFEDLVAFLGERVFPYHAREPHPHFMGYIPSSPTFPAVLGDWIAAGYNFFAGVWTVASGPNQIELTVLDWFRSWLGMPSGTSGLLTSGGSTATLTAVVAARHAADPSGEKSGRLALYTSEQAHSSVQRAAWIAGIPRANVCSVPTDDQYRLRDEALRKAIADDRSAGRIPFLVVASAGTTNTGAVDPLNEIADLCERENLWMHVDAAYAGFAALTRQGAAALDGLGRADSVTLDPHKWLFVPFECGCLLAREPQKLEEAFSVHPEYLTDVRARDQDVNFADYGEQLTRSSHALKIWLSIQYFGLSEIREAIARGIHRAEYAERLFAAHRDFEILSPAQFGVVCFRARPADLDDGADLDALNERINARVNSTGRFLISSTKLRGRFSLRLCTHVHRMTDADIDEVYEAIIDALQAED